MSIVKMLSAFHAISDTIWEMFGQPNSGGEWIEDYTNCNWFNNGNEEIRVIRDGDEYSFEIYGASIWHANGCTMAKVYNGSGEMYCVFMEDQYQVVDGDQWEELVRNGGS